MHNHLFEEEEMANVSSDITGLPYDLWVDSLGQDRNTEHNEPRIKVEIEPHKYVPIIVSDNPQLPSSVQKTGLTNFRGLQLVKKYVKNYKDIFLAHYNRKINDSQLLYCLGSLNDYVAAIEKLNKLTAKKDITINYCWDDVDLLYQIEAVDSDNNIVATAFVMTEKELFTTIENYKKRFETNNVKNIVK